MRVRLAAHARACETGLAKLNVELRVQQCNAKKKNITIFYPILRNKNYISGENMTKTTVRMIIWKPDKICNFAYYSYL